MTRALAAVASMWVGGSVYVLWRDQDLLMFTWLSAAGLSPSIEALRATAFPLRSVLPQWFLYSLPEALWLLSGLLALNVVWGTGKHGGYLFWSLSLATIAVGSELGQLLSVVPGRFDSTDLALMLAACAIAGFAAWIPVIERRAGVLC